jgi:hypothetical protein
MDRTIIRLSLKVLLLLLILLWGATWRWTFVYNQRNLFSIAAYRGVVTFYNFCHDRTCLACRVNTSEPYRAIWLPRLGAKFLLVPLWLSIGLTGTSVLLLRNVKRSATLCARCGYDLRGSSSTVCSECGEHSKPDQARGSQSH